MAGVAEHAHSTLRTDRLLLRRWRGADRAPFAALDADPVVMEHFPSPLTPAESDAVLDGIESRFDQRGHGLWAVEERARRLPVAVRMRH